MSSIEPSSIKITSEEYQNDVPVIHSIYSDDIEEEDLLPIDNKVSN